MHDTMIINKYLDSKKKEFEQTFNKDDIASVQSDTNLFAEWNRQKAEMIKELINEEYIQVNSDKYKDLLLFDLYENVTK